MFKYDELKKYWESYFDEEKENEIKDKYKQVFADEFKIAKDQGFYSDDQTFLGEVFSRTEDIVIKFFEKKAFDSLPAYQFMGVPFWDKFLFLSIDNLLQARDFKFLLSDLFCDLASEIKEDLYEKGIVDHHGDLIKTKKDVTGFAEYIKNTWLFCGDTYLACKEFHKEYGLTFDEAIEIRSKTLL